MDSERDYRYDVFVSYNAADQDWVATVLLPRLEEAGLRVAVDYRDFVVGKPLIENIEAAVDASRRTIVVLSPDWVASEWNAFEALLLRTEDPAATRRKLLPLRLRPCELPAGLARLKLDVADLTAERYKEAQLERVVRDVEDLVPMALPSSVRDWGAWRRWLRRYRRPVRWGVIAALLLALFLAMTLQVFPFQQEPTWIASQQEFPGGQAIYSTGDTLLTGAKLATPGCAGQPQAIWFRASYTEAWQESVIRPSICIKYWNPPAFSDIVDFATAAGNFEAIYALTSHSGVLVSTDGGASFDQAAPHPEANGLPASGATSLVVLPGTPATLWVSTAEDGIWRYQSGLWNRMDGSTATGCAGLPVLTTASLLALERTLVFGTDRHGLWASVDGGATCHVVFDGGVHGRYQFGALAAADAGQSGRLLAVVRDWDGVERNWEVLDLCAYPGACDAQTWQAEPPIPLGPGSVSDLVVQTDGQGGGRWYVATEWFGRVYSGNLNRPGIAEHLPAILGCIGEDCHPGLALAGLQQVPILVAEDHVFTYQVGPWWHRFWFDTGFLKR